MFRDVRHACGHHLLCLGVLPHDSHDLGILRHRHMHLNVRLMVLEDERLEWLALQDVHVLRNWILGLHVVWQRHELLGVLDTQNVQHGTVQLREVVNLRGHLRHLDHSLILHNPLAHGRSVGVTDRNDVYV